MWRAYDHMDSTLDAVFYGVETRDKRKDAVSLSAAQPISFALLGIDSYGDELEEMGGRSDTIIVVTINPQTKQTTLVSIPRDSYTEMVNYQTDINNEYNDKITHAYAFGGTEMALNSIQEFLNVPVDHYVEINMHGLEYLVDAIGGIEITSPLTFEYNGASFKSGDTVTLQGWEVLAFARMRYDDPQGDTGRQQRQQLVIKAIIDQLLSIEGISNYEAILSSVGMSMRTNLTFENLVDIQKYYSDSITSYEQYLIPGVGMYMEDIYYYYVQPEERLRISNLLREELGLEQVSVDDLNFSDADLQFGYGGNGTLAK
ncbi:LCP family protein [Trichococcus sp. K1Tr]|uniref:LCP family glycopolymer transferase n=1 Tax=Trichococcus sp. K1Tr TaxID=3020847 RepID=UPI00232DAD9E|nr:LCP family protein [Trichococcus sp. K1Tr]MDB6354127.1 LCP family protein [Trichococcus sp. K1Tr]